MQHKNVITDQAQSDDDDDDDDMLMVSNNGNLNTVTPTIDSNTAWNRLLNLHIGDFITWILKLK